ncbi:hypothetical protein R1sor_004390 [Riccia sorocarpa]|uniref:Uncharacterized protein n=1 Tax=Riccia sorocarpa TaxID=122646 RepID=A0ABD3HMX0_9MARC
MVSSVWTASGGRSEESKSSGNMTTDSGQYCDEVVEKLHHPQHKKHQIFSKGLTLSNFSKSFVTLQTSLTRIAHLSPRSHSHSSVSSQSAPGSPVCESPRSDETSSSTLTSVSSSSSSGNSHGSSSTPSTPRKSHHHAKRPTCVAFGRLHGHSKRSKSIDIEERRPVLLDKMPSGKSSQDYITVYVGIKRTQRVKYVICRDLLSHHLLQVLLKCSEDEFGQEYAQKGGIAIICDPALFLQVVKVVDDSMRDSRVKVSAPAEDEDSPFDSELQCHADDIGVDDTVEQRAAAGPLVMRHQVVMYVLEHLADVP